MSEIFAEATVTLVPDTKGFASKLQTQLKDLITDIEASKQAPKIRIAPALTKNFIGSLRTQVNTAIDRAQVGVKPIRVQVALGQLPAGQLREIQRASVRGFDPASMAALAAGFGSVTQATERATQANQALIPTQKRISEGFARGAADLSVFASAEETASKQGDRLRGARDVAGSRDQSRAEKELAAARIARAAATSTAIPREKQLQLLSSAQSRFVTAEALATEELTGKTKLSADAKIRAQVVQANAGRFAREITEEIEGEARARQRSSDAARVQARVLREASTEAGRHARTQAQLRRGALATSLSFLGIRGATLAASAAFLAGAAAIAIFSKALDSATRFQDQLNVFRATTSATRTELEAVANASRALGADLSLPGVTAGDAAEAMTELAKAGLDVQNSIAGARGVLQLATAAAIDNAQAVELVANALNAFELQGADATRVADTFANAANAAQGSIVDIGIAFQQSAAAGRQVGLSFEDTTEFLTVLARAGLRGSDAGTSLRTALIRLINPSKEAAARLQQLGVQVRDASGKLRPDVFIQIAEATRNLGPAARDATIALLGGQDAFRAISILGRQSIEDFIRLRRELREQGTAGELASARMQGLRGSLEGLGNSLSTIGVRIGQSLTPPLQEVVQGISGMTTAMASSETVARTFGGSLDFITASINGLLASVQALGTVLAPVAGLLAGVANAAGVANILALVVAYKLFGVVAKRAAASQIAFAVGMEQAAAAGRSAAAGALLPLTTRLSALVRGFNLWGIAIAAVTAGLFFLITRETALERANRRLAESTEALVDAQQRLNAARDVSSTSGLSINAARLGVAQAQDAVRAAQANVNAAPAGTFARTRAELELAVALDNVKIAQRDLNKAVQEAADSREVTLNLIQQERAARREQIDNLRELAEAERRRTRLGPGDRGGGRFRGESAAEANLRRETRAAEAFREELQKRIQALREEGDIDSLNQAKRLQLIKQVSAAVGRIPDKIIKLTLNADSLQDALRKVVTSMAGVGREGQVAFLRAFAQGASPQMRAAIQQMIRDITSNTAEVARSGGHKTGFEWGQGVIEGATQQAPAIANTFASIIKRATGRVQGLERQGRQLEIEGAPLSVRLANARQAEQEARDILARLRARGANEGKITAQQNEVLRLIAARQAIEDEIAAAEQEAADAAEEAANAADQRALNRLERTRTRVQNRISDAQATETLADDLRATIVFRNLIRRQINRIKDLIKDRQTQIQAIQALQAIEQDLEREITSLQKQRRQQIRDRIAESIQLDIEFGQITGNARLEINARLREIARLKKLQALAKKDIVERKRLRNLIAQQVEAINDLREAERDRGRAFQELSFQFLTTQQGFAANLLSNLLAPGTFGGTVGARIAAGGGSPLGKDVDATGKPVPGVAGGPASKVTGALGAAAAGTGPAGPTRGQQTVELDLLRQILRAIEALGRNTKHPENKQQHKLSNAKFETHK